MTHSTTLGPRTAGLGFVLIATCIAAPTALAQVADGDAEQVVEQRVFMLRSEAPPPPLAGPHGIVSVVGRDFGARIEGAPYSADAVTESIQQLADGNRIVRRQEARVYRDSEGRTRREQALGMLGPWAIEAGAPSLVTIDDPVAGKSYALNPEANTATMLSNVNVSVDTSLVSVSPRDPQAARAGVAVGGAVVLDSSADLAVTDAPAVGVQSFVLQRTLGDESAPAMPVPQVHMVGPGGAGPGFFVSAVAPPLGESRTEDLGEQVLQGVLARGTRVTQTIPAQAIGNERPIDVVSEYWFSAELGVDIVRTTKDPRVGETSYRLVNIDRSEPPPELFTLPSGYEVAGGTDRTAPVSIAVGERSDVTVMPGERGRVLRFVPKPGDVD